MVVENLFHTDRISLNAQNEPFSEKQYVVSNGLFMTFNEQQSINDQLTVNGEPMSIPCNNPHLWRGLGRSLMVI